MQISDWGDVLIHHVREWKHRKYSQWACLFSGVKNKSIRIYFVTSECFVFQACCKWYSFHLLIWRLPFPSLSLVLVAQKNTTFLGQVLANKAKVWTMCDHHHLRSPTPVGIVDHIVSLSENFGELVDSDEYADITLVVENTHFKGHKIILAARSEYFRWEMRKVREKVR